MRKIILLLLILILLAGCGQEYPIIEDRESVIVPDKIKKTPETDRLPPILHSDEYEEPVPMPYPINTAGHEDSGFIMPDGNTFYVWFAPGATSLAEQLDDGVTAIYEHKKVDGEWQQSERVMLRKLTEQSLDGCEFVQDNMMWFCTARTGYTGLHWFTAEYKDNKWQNVKIADFDPSYEVGELHFTADGKELYFHSPREGGLGGYDPSPKTPNVKSIRTEKWKLIYTTTTKKKELYNLEKDPNENDNLIGKGFQEEKNLWDKLKKETTT